jgi:hypothetical protein
MGMIHQFVRSPLRRTYQSVRSPFIRRNHQFARSPARGAFCRKCSFPSISTIIHSCMYRYKHIKYICIYIYIYIYIYITWQCLFLFKDYNIGMDTTNKSEIENKWYMEIVDMVTTTNRFRRSRSVSNCPAAAFFDFPWQTDRSRLHLYETVPWWLCSRRICMGNKTDTAIYDICIYIYIYMYMYMYII